VAGLPQLPKWMSGGCAATTIGPRWSHGHPGQDKGDYTATLFFSFFFFLFSFFFFLFSFFFFLTRLYICLGFLEVRGILYRKHFLKCRPHRNTLQKTLFTFIFASKHLIEYINKHHLTL
jgi:hypothetical protein